MKERGLGRTTAILTAAAGLPLLGAWLAGRNLGEIFQFPPRLKIPANYPHFSWRAAVAIGLTLAAVVGPWFFQSRTGFFAKTRPPGTSRNRPLAWWGWLALVWTATWWFLAWTRFPCFAPAQRYTFFPLWLGFIVSTNALIQRRCGACLMRRAPRTWLGLFAASAAFWWMFEWLNRFVRNWHYLGVADFSAAAYAGNATLCFSTVLPAVAAASEWLGTHPRWEARCAAGPAWRWLRPRATGWALMLLSAAALVLTGARPEQFYPAIWAAPLLLALGEGIAARRPGLAGEVAAGDWRRAATWAVAALICGVFWELWNVRSAAQWIYTVPYVDRWHIFEMPLLGYAGYLPFGLECLLVSEPFLRRIGPSGGSPPLTAASPR